jgi:hypothetical protein
MMYVVFGRAIAAKFHEVRIKASIGKACGHVRDSAINVVAGGLIRELLCQRSRSEVATREGLERMRMLRKGGSGWGGGRGRKLEGR